MYVPLVNNNRRARWRGLARTLDGEVLELVILLKGGGRLLLGLLGLGLVGGSRLVVLLGL